MHLLHVSTHGTGLRPMQLKRELFSRLLVVLDKSAPLTSAAPCHLAVSNNPDP